MSIADTTTGIADKAARWAARAAYGEMTEAASGELNAWLAADRRHRGAYLRARAGLCAMEDAVRRAPHETSAVNDNLSSPATGWTGFGRKGRAVFAGAALAACAVGLLLMSPLQVPFTSTSETAAESVMLSDGTTAMLAEGAQIATLMKADRRMVIVRSGEATFRVARDQARPFIVRTGDVYAQATGTVYSVKKLSHSGGAVTVSEGTVLVWAGGARSRAVSLGAGESLTLNPKQATLALPKPVTVPPAARRASGELSFDNVPIAAAAKRFNAINEAQIVIKSSAVGDTPIVGLFSADDPESFARAAAAVAGARVTKQGDLIAIEM